MSAENRPNINAAGLMVAFVNGIRDNLRGPAKEHEAEVLLEYTFFAKDLADTISDELDDKYGRG